MLKYLHLPHFGEFDGSGLLDLVFETALELLLAGELLIDADLDTVEDADLLAGREEEGEEVVLVLGDLLAAEVIDLLGLLDTELVIELLALVVTDLLLDLLVVVDTELVLDLLAPEVALAEGVLEILALVDTELVLD